MSDSIKLLTASLSEDQLQTLVQDLSSLLKDFPEKVTSLCEILQQSQFVLGLDSIAAANIWLYIEDIYTSDNGNAFSSAIELLRVVPAFQDRIVEKIEQDLSAFIAASKSQFLSQIIKGFEYETSDTHLPIESLQHRLVFLEQLLIACKNSHHRDYNSLDKLLYSYLAINDDDILAAISRCLRWRILHLLENEAFHSVWSTIFEVIDKGNSGQLTAAFTLWIRIVDKVSLHKDTDPTWHIDFQRVVVKTEYWELLQLGLASVSPEHRRITLSILQLSVKLIDVSFENLVMLWDTRKSQILLKEWQRFVTLYEVVAIDTSLHQAQAGSKSIVELISPKSNIHPSWGLCLLSTGFKATMDSARKFTLSLTLSLPEDSMELLKYGPEFLKLTFLPYAMLASHFIVRSDGAKETCPYGERLSSFITSMLRSMKSKEDLQFASQIILEVLQQHKEAFDPARIYLCYGLLQGIDSSILSYKRHLAPLIDLFECNCEGDVFETTSETIYLRLLLKFELTSLREFVLALLKFLKFNGNRVLKREIDSILAYLKDNHIGEDDFMALLDITDLMDEKIMAFGLADLFSEGSWPQLEIFISKQLDEFLCSILASGLKLTLVRENPVFSKLFEGMIMRLEKTHDADLIGRLSNADGHKLSVLSTSSSIKNYLKLLKSELASSEHSTLIRLLDTFCFFNKLVRGEPSAISMSDIFDIMDHLFVNSQEAAKHDTNFYKIRDRVEGHFIELLSIWCGHIEPSDDDLLLFINFIKSSSSLERNLAVCSFAEVCLGKSSDETLLEKVSHLLSSIWEELDSSRLQLNQKSLQVAVIQDLFSSKLLTLSTTNLAVRNDIHEVALSVIRNASGRRTILPVMTESLFVFRMSHQQEFEQILFVPEVLVLAYTVYQIRYNVFKLESVIGTFYDTKFELVDGGLYAKTYGAQEISARINVISILGTSLSSEFRTKVLDYILDHEDELHLFNPIKSTDGVEEWTRIQLLSVVVAVLGKRPPQNKSLVAVFFEMLGKEPSPLVRIYVEWILALLLSDYKQIFEGFSLINESSGSMPVLFTAYERIVFLLSQKLGVEEQSKLLTELLPHVIIGSTSNKALIRHFSLSLTCSIYSEIEEKGLKIPDEIYSLVSELYTSAVNSEAYGKYRNGDALMWNIQNDLSLVGLLGGVLLKVSDRQIDSVSEDIIREYLSNEKLLLLEIDVGEDERLLWVAQRKHQDSKREVGVANLLQDGHDESPLQTKSGAWNGTIDLDERTINRSDLIVVSSLVDKAPNLGGICRLCDVLGAGLLTLNDIRAKNNPHFKNVAVTADRWMPMQEVTVDQIKNFMVQKKTEGYTLVGLEQTDKSVELNNNLKFPKKSLILLGREKEGIPGDLLAELDFCVEIKQVGVIRSMNIQTATAVIVHAYSSQHC